MTDDERIIREALANPALHDEGAPLADTWTAVYAVHAACSPDRIERVLAELERLREALTLLVDTASQEWQEADGSRRGAIDNSGERMWFISKGVMDFARAALENKS